jgi:hypothetical protein
MKEHARSRLMGARAYVLLTFDGRGSPVFFSDPSGCDNEKDVRHVFIRRTGRMIEGGLAAMNGFAAKRFEELQQADKVTDAKKRRSEELSVFNSEGPAEKTRGGSDNGEDSLELSKKHETAEDCGAVLGVVGATGNESVAELCDEARSANS